MITKLYDFDLHLSLFRWLLCMWHASTAIATNGVTQRMYLINDPEEQYDKKECRNRRKTKCSANTMSMKSTDEPMPISRLIKELKRVRERELETIKMIVINSIRRIDYSVNFRRSRSQGHNQQQKYYLCICECKRFISHTQNTMLLLLLFSC